MDRVSIGGEVVAAVKRVMLALAVVMTGVAPAMADSDGGPVPAFDEPASETVGHAVAAWCGGSYGAEGTNFGPCGTTERLQVAGRSSGVTPQAVQTTPQYPATAVTFEDGKVLVAVEGKEGKIEKQPLHLNWVAAPDRSVEPQSPGD
ncbi:MAG TPA: hypothetical protein VNN07_17705 [Candidatus Tectomicrobia bacterium]|nr:hypothetical protein [Candidatus Tectomicrobia bacterium]